MKNGKPDVIDILSENIQEKPFSAQLDFRISISDSAYKAIIKHAKEDQNIEICGILIGEVFKDTNGPYLEISDIIKGEHADNQAGQVMFTHETWEYINSVKDGQFANKLIVGWYHTHPRFGIFLSDQDVFIQRNFFDKPWQVAFVVDPIQEEEGFFIWRTGIPEKTKHYWLDGREVVDNEIIKKVEKLCAERISSVEVEKTDEKSKIPSSYLIFGFTIVLLLFLTILYLLRTDIFTFLSSWKPKTNSSISNQQPINENKPIVITLDSLFKKMIDSKLVQKLSILEIDPYEKKIYFGGEVYTQAQKDALRNLLLSILKNEGFFDLQKIIVTHTYITGPGENLSQIADKIYGNPKLSKDLYFYQSFWMQLLDTTEIKPYTRLYLPELK